MSVAGVKGTIDFRHDTVNDIVISRPRWTLDSSVEVMRWYQVHAGYFGGRFQDRKDLIVVNDAFDVVPKVAALWGQYRAKLHETYVRFSVRVNNNARVRLTTNTSAARYTISALETATLEEAIAAILEARAQMSPQDDLGLKRRTSSPSLSPPSLAPPSGSFSSIVPPSTATPLPPSGDGPPSVTPRSLREGYSSMPPSGPIQRERTAALPFREAAARDARPITEPTATKRPRTAPPGTKRPPKASES